MTDIENQREVEKYAQKVNRKYKDSVFCDYLAEPARLIEVYNAAFGSNYPPDAAVEITKLDDVLYMERINDLSFILDDKFVVLLEQQSTVNENMALRMLLYVARLYEKVLDNENLYKKRRIQVFTPQFVMFYNGSENQPECMLQRLSDLFKVKTEHPMLELKVVIFNIRRSGSYVPEILKRCSSLNEYSILMEQIEIYRREGYELGDAIKEAIKVCQARGIMNDYLKAKGSEAVNMLNAEWDWDVARKVWREEDFEEGREQGMQQGIEKGRHEGAELKQQAIIRSLCAVMSPEMIAETLQLSLDYVQDVLKQPKAAV